MSIDICLELREGQNPGEYRVHVLRAPAGGQTSGVIDLDVEHMLGSLHDLEMTVLASSVPARRMLAPAEEHVQSLGSSLFAAAFPRDVYGTYRASLAAAAQKGERLRLVLNFAAPELAALPWELMFDPGLGSYICRSEPLLRTIPAEGYHSVPLRITPPLRILGIVASPRGMPPLDVEGEKQHLAEALAAHTEAGQIELVWTEAATWDEIHDLLLEGPWHAVHFIGHGDYDALHESGLIIINGADGKPHRVSAEQLVDLLSTAAPVPRLVFLNSCNSGRSGDEDLFSSTAAALVRAGIPAVVAMQFTVSDDGAVAFSRGFYKALAAGRSVDEATRNGRIAMRGHSDTSLEWVTPVLCVRGGVTELFTLGRRTARGAKAAAPQPRDTAPQPRDTAPQPRDTTRPAPAPPTAPAPPPATERSATVVTSTLPAVPHPATHRSVRIGDDAGGLAISADGGLLAVGRRRGVTLLDAATGERVRDLRTDGGRDFTAVAFSPDAAQVAAGSWFGSLCAWDAETGEETFTATAGTSVDALAHTGTHLLVSTLEDAPPANRQHVRVWNVATGAEGGIWRALGGAEALDVVALSPYGSWLAESVRRGAIEVLDLTRAAARLRRRVARVPAPGGVRALAVNAPSARLAVGSVEVGLSVWRLEGGSPRLDVVRSEDVRRLAFDVAGTRLAVGLADGHVLVLDPDSGRVIARLAAADRPLALAFGGDALATLDGDGTVELWVFGDEERGK